MSMLFWTGICWPSVVSWFYFSPGRAPFSQTSVSSFPPSPLVVVVFTNRVFSRRLANCVSVFVWGIKNKSKVIKVEFLWLIYTSYSMHILFIVIWTLISVCTCSAWGCIIAVVTPTRLCMDDCFCMLHFSVFPPSLVQGSSFQCVEDMWKTSSSFGSSWR